MNSEEPAVIVKDLYKTFKLPHEQHSGIKQAVISVFNTKRGYESQKVLNDISFEIKKGEFFGIVGRNGSGKSTLLKILAGIYAPDKGLVQVNGSLTPFIELGVGFNPELTGRENVYMNGALLGFDHNQMDAMYDKIVEFAELEKFMDQKLKNYSSGMQVRLAFSIAIKARSDILLLDEVLAVGDAAFQTKCFDYFQSLKKSKTTVIFVSHDRAALERFCQKGILVDEGRIIERGDIKKVLKAYSSVVLKELDDAEDEASPKIRPSEHASISNIKAFTEPSDYKKRFIFGEDMYIQYDVTFKKRIKDPIMGVTLFQKNIENAVFATNTMLDGIKTGNYNNGDKVTFKLKLPQNLNDGEYYIEPAVANESASTFYDQIPKALTIYINGSSNPYSLLSGDDRITLEKAAK